VHVIYMGNIRSSFPVSELRSTAYYVNTLKVLLTCIAAGVVLNM